MTEEHKDPVPLVWVVLYSHKHGLDMSVHKSEVGAQKYALGLINQYRHEWIDLGDEAEPKSDEDLFPIWDEITHGHESIELDKFVLNE